MRDQKYFVLRIIQILIYGNFGRKCGIIHSYLGIITIISPKTRQKCNKENWKSLIVKDFRFLFRDSVGSKINLCSLEVNDYADLMLHVAVRGDALDACLEYV